MFWNKKKQNKAVNDEETLVIIKYIEEHSPTVSVVKELNSRYFPNLTRFTTMQMEVDSWELLKAFKNMKTRIEEFQKYKTVLEQKDEIKRICKAFVEKNSIEDIQRKLDEKKVYLSRLPEYTGAYDFFVADATKKENPGICFNEKEYQKSLENVLSFYKVDESFINGFGSLEIQYISELGGFKKTVKTIVPNCKEWYEFVLTFVLDQ